MTTLMGADGAAEQITPCRPVIFTFTQATGDSDFGDCRCPNCRPALYQVPAGLPRRRATVPRAALAATPPV